MGQPYRGRGTVVGAPPRAATFFLLVAVAFALSLGWDLASTAWAQEREQAVTVTRVVDGDTVEVSPAIGGKEDVRLIGVDTPETVAPGIPVQPYGPEASRFTTRELEGARVTLEFDQDREDQFDRLLAYVRLPDGSLFNETLLSRGYAQVNTVQPNDRYEARFRRAQQRAKEAGLGIWGLPEGQQCQLANLGNGIGEGSPGCDGAAPQPEPQNPAPQQPAPEGPEPRKVKQPRPTLPETGGLPLVPPAALLAATAGVAGVKILRRS